MKSILLLFTFIYCASLNAQTYEDVAEAHGINATFGSGALGGGISFVDFDMDGRDDLTFASSLGDSIHFYLNNQGIFTKIPSLVNHTEHSSQVLWVDYDNDGDRDFFVSSRFGTNRLYQNDGSLNLTEVTTQVGLPSTLADTYGAHFGDINNDGWLDLYVLNRHLHTHYNYLYLFDGTKYTDITSSSGLKYDTDMSFVAAFFDYNQDGYQDIYIAEDKYFGNKLFENNGDTTFTEVSSNTNCYYEMDAMNVGIGDPNNDGWPDIYITNTPISIDPESKYLVNVNGADFDEMALDLDLNFAERTGWGANWLDCDNDGDEDLYVCASSSIPPSNNPQNALYINQDTIFVETNLSNDTKKSYCNAVGDFNNDGHLDIAVSHADSAYSLLENQTQDSLHWLKISLEGTTANREGIGSEIEIWTNGAKQTRWVLCGEAYLAQNSFKQHFGLDTISIVDSLKVTWLGGQEDIYYDLAVDSTYQFSQGATVLPIELIHFEAHALEQEALISWAIARSELGDKIQLERSSDGQSFSTIAIFPIKNIQQKAFEYIDKTYSYKPHFYYRLALIDNDGSIDYSSIQCVTFNLTPELKVYPTIRKDEPLNIQSSGINVKSVSVMSSDGSIVFKKEYPKALSNIQILDIDLTTGVHYVLIKLHSEKLLVSTIIQN